MDAGLVAGLAANGTAVRVLGADGHGVGVVRVERARGRRARLLAGLELGAAAEEGRVNAILAGDPGESSGLLGGKSRQGKVEEHLDGCGGMKVRWGLVQNAWLRRDGQP